MILRSKLDKIILLCIKELYMNCIEPLDLSEMTFIEVIDTLNKGGNNFQITKSNFDSIYDKWISSEDMKLLQRDTFYTTISSYKPQIVSDDFIPESND